MHLADSLVSQSLSQDETSEMFIGEWAEKRGIRDQLVIATKPRRLLIFYPIPKPYSAVL